MLIIKSNVSITTVQDDIALLQSKAYNSSERAINWNPNNQKQVFQTISIRHFLDLSLWSRNKRGASTPPLHSKFSAFSEENLKRNHTHTAHQLTAMKHRASTLNINHKQAPSKWVYDKYKKKTDTISELLVQERWERVLAVPVLQVKPKIICSDWNLHDTLFRGSVCNKRWRSVVQRCAPKLYTSKSFYIHLFQRWVHKIKLQWSLLSYGTSQNSLRSLYSSALFLYMIVFSMVIRVW